MADIKKILDYGMKYSASLGSLSWPILGRIFKEKLEIDENTSLWTKLLPNYEQSPTLKGEFEADLTIIGGGFTGISSAYHFSRRYPNKRVILIEARSLGNGASGRSSGLMLNWLANQSDYPDKLLPRTYQVTSDAIKSMVEIIKLHNLKVSYRMDGTLQLYTSEERAKEGEKYVSKLREFGIPIEFLNANQLEPKFTGQGVYGAAFDPNSGQINGLEYIRSLKPVLLSQGVEIFENSPAIEINEGETILIKTASGQIRSKAIVLATDAYTSKLGYFKDAIFPIHSHVIAFDPGTNPEGNKCSWGSVAGFSDDFDRISFSSETPEGHLVFGGGCNSAYSYRFNNRTIDHIVSNKVFTKIHNNLIHYCRASKNFDYAYSWSGPLGVTLRRNMLLGVRGEHRNVFYSLGYCGHGIVLANLAGKILTDIYSGEDQQWKDMPFYQDTYSPLPPEPLRWIGYQLFTRLTGSSPRL